jgi:hypothetical protein
VVVADDATTTKREKAGCRRRERWGEGLRVGGAARPEKLLLVFVRGAGAEPARGLEEFRAVHVGGGVSSSAPRGGARDVATRRREAAAGGSPWQKRHRPSTTGSPRAVSGGAAMA